MMLRSVVLTGVATTCVIAGPALAPAAVGAAAPLLSAIAGVGAAVLGEVAYNGLCSGYDNVAKRLRDAAENGKLPENHDLIRAIRLSQLSGVIFVATTLREDIHQDPESYPDTLKFFCDAVIRWAEDEIANTKKNKFDLTMKDEDWRGVMSLAEPPISEEEPSHDYQTQLSKLGKAAEKAFYEELELALRRRSAEFIPKEFLAHFHGESGTLGWMKATQAYFAEKVKSDAKVRTVVFLEGLEAVQNGISTIVTEVRGVTGLIGERFNALEERIDALLERIESSNTEYLDRCIAELHEAILSDKTVDALFDKLVMSMPRGTRWMQPAAQTQQRIDELTEFFVGREDEFQNLDNIVDGLTGADRGLWVVTAPAGSGKSALLAKWVERRQRSGDLVARHFISHQFDRTTSKETISGHLLSQILQMNEFAEAGTPETASAQHDQVFDQLRQSSSTNEKRIIVLDGLDEADSLIEPFVEPGFLAEGVFVIVSARADPDTIPLYVEKWLSRLGRDVPGARICLGGLGAKSIEVWLEEFIAHLSETEMSELSGRIREATDGLPLFVRFVVEDLSAAMPKLSDQAERLKLIQDLPAPFPKYVRKQIEKMSEGPDSVWQGAIPFMMALLSRLFGPINFGELRDFPQLKELPQETRTLPHSITRWLSIRESKISFQHPRLAEAFSSAIGSQDEVEAISDYVLDAEDIFIEWMETAWKPQESRRGEIAGCAYALDWLPHHLERLGDNAQSKCASILANFDFLITRLSDPETVSARLARHVDTWFRLPISIRMVDDHRIWDSFWIENESVLLIASEYSSLCELPFSQVINNCLGDAGVASAQPLSILAHLPRSSALVRAHRNVHSDWVRGVRELESGRLVSYGDDGGVLFWHADGTRARGGDAGAHSGGVIGVWELESGRLVSYGEDGGVLFWHADGTRAPGGDAGAHSEGFVSVRKLESGRLVSFGEDGGVLFWHADGTRAPGGDAKAYSAGADGFVVFDDGRLASCGGDGGVLFWNADGTRAPGGDAAAHSGPVRGLKVLDSGYLVSYCKDGGVAFWGADGTRAPGGDAAAHSGPVRGLKVLDSGYLVTYCEDGGVAFWGADGTRAPGGDAAAHLGPVRGVEVLGDGRSVSCSEDGDMLFWGADGTRIPRADKAAHSGCVQGLKVLDNNYLVSYDADGGVLFWNADGTRAPGGDAAAHSGSVRGLKVLQNGRIVSHCDHGGVLFWCIDGTRAPGGDVAAHSSSIRGIQALEDGYLVSYCNDGGVLFWGIDGRPVPGGDPAAHSHRIWGATVQQGGRLVTYDEGGGILFWDINSIQTPTGDAEAYSSSYLGTQALDNSHLVSFGYDGSVLFWDANATKVLGGDTTAHSRPVRGVRVLEGRRLVSYGQDGGVLFWNADGTQAPGGSANAHSRPVRGVRVLEGRRLVSYGEDGGVLFWNANGTQASGGDPAAHSGWVQGLQLLKDDRLVSYGDEGGVLFWRVDGTRAAGGDSSAHSGWVRGVQLLKDGRQIVSYDLDSMVFWDCHGVPVFRGSLAAHSSSVNGLRVLNNGRLISYCSAGGVLFWNADGTRAPGGSVSAHSDHVRGVRELEGGRLVSYCCGGGMLFWNADGTRASGGDEAAHSDMVTGVFQLEDGRIVSCGEDGGFLYWDADGNRAPGGDPNAHRAGIIGVNKLDGEQLISWDREWLSFWDKDGQFKGRVVPPGGIRHVLLTDDRLVVAGRSIWIYSLRDGMPF